MIDAIRLPHSVRHATSGLLEKAFNAVLALDPDTRESLQKLDGECLDIHFDGPNITLRLNVDGQRLVIQLPDADRTTSLRVSATPGSFLSRLLTGQRENFRTGKVDVSGNADLARQIEKLASHYTPDFETAFARVFGDVAGVALAQALAKALAHARTRHAHFKEDAADWLCEESNLTVTGGEMEDFCDDVDALNAHVRQLEARINKLTGRQVS